MRVEVIAIAFVGALTMALVAPLLNDGGLAGRLPLRRTSQISGRQRLSTMHVG